MLLQCYKVTTAQDVRNDLKVNTCTSLLRAPCHFNRIPAAYTPLPNTCLQEIMLGFKTDSVQSTWSGFLGNQGAVLPLPSTNYAQLDRVLSMLCVCVFADFQRFTTGVFDMKVSVPLLIAQS